MMSEETIGGVSITHMADSAITHVGNSVLPITDYTTQSSAAKCNEQCSNEGLREKAKGEKMKPIARVKELLKWAAAAAKAEKGGKYIGRKVMHFRNRSSLKTVPDHDQLSNGSPKISFRWDVESCSTTSSVYSAISDAISISCSMRVSANSTPFHARDQSGRGNWITTDSEFVVLEL